MINLEFLKVQVGVLCCLVFMFMMINWHLSIYFPHVCWWCGLHVIKKCPFWHFIFFLFSVFFSFVVVVFYMAVFSTVFKWLFHLLSVTKSVYQFIRQIQSNCRREKTIFKKLGVITDSLLTFKAQVFKNVNGVHFKHIRSDLTTKG